MANVGIKEKKAWGYFSFVTGHKYSDICYIELEASRDVPFEDAEVLSEYDAIDDDSYFVENYKPEQAFEAFKKAVELVERGWIHVKVVVHLQDKETKSRSYFKFEYDRVLKETALQIGATLKAKKERGGGGE